MMGRLIKPDVSIEEALKEPEKWIPDGCYCYYWHSDGKHFMSEDKTGYLCPFWDRNHDKESWEDGYCHYLNLGDWMEDSFSLLWDMCKECDINDEDWMYE